MDFLEWLHIYFGDRAHQVIFLTGMVFYALIEIITKKFMRTSKLKLLLKFSNDKKN
jgi:hypothetical protein